MFGSASYTALFNPMTYEDFAKPLIMYKQEVDSLGDAYGQLGDLANQYANSIDKNSNAYATMQGYNNGLKTDVEDLFNNGLNNVNKSKFLQRRNQYQQDILAINTAAKKMLADEDFAKQAQLKGILTFNKGTIDDYVANINYTPQMIDLNKLEEVGKQLGANESNGILQTAFRESGAQGYLEYVQRVGGDLEMAKKLLNTDKTLNATMDQAVSSLGVDKAKNPDVYNKAMQTLALGYVKGFGQKVSSQPISDKVWDFNKQLELQTLKKQTKKTDVPRTVFDRRPGINAKGESQQYTYHHPYQDTKIMNRISGEVWNRLSILGKKAKSYMVNIDAKTGKENTGWFFGLGRTNVTAADAKDRTKQFVSMELASDMSHAILQTYDGEFYRVRANDFTKIFGQELGERFLQMRNVLSTFTNKNKLKEAIKEDPALQPFYESLYGEGANYYDTYNKVVFPKFLNEILDGISGNQQLLSESGDNE